MDTKILFLSALTMTSFCYAYKDVDEIATEIPFGKEAYTREKPMPMQEDEFSYSEDEVLVANIDGVYVYEGDAPVSSKEKSGISGVEFSRSYSGLSLHDQIILQQRISKAVLYQPLTRKKISEIRSIIIDFYKTHDRPFVLVTIPEQDITDRVLAISVIEAKLGNITVTGNKWFSSDQYLKEISLQKGSFINSAKLVNDLTWLNRNPFRTTNAVFKPGTALYTTDVEIVADDYKPFQFYLGADNTGFHITDYGRLFAGINWGNAFNAGHILAYQFTSSPDFHKFLSQTLSYTIPLPWRDFVSFFGGYSTLHASNSPGLPSNKTHGQDWQVSGRYTFVRPMDNSLQQEFKAGLDYKRTNNDFSVGEEVISNSIVSEFLIAGEYNAQIVFPKFSVDAGGQLYISPGSLSSAMSKSAYDPLRNGATPLYAFTRLGSRVIYNLPMDFLLDMRARVQLTTGSLLPIEQFGMGGVDTVRGYINRAVNLDNALLFNVEAKTPAISLMKYFTKSTKAEDGLRGVVFLDAGGGWENTSIEGLNKWSTLIGIGPGLRYAISPYINARLDYGVALTTLPSPLNCTTRLYYSVVASY
ncbi:MAG: ShlB/FhaC/HecB family hemolysin secretion/activation protein [Chlamydiae bacterium]|nr:ShlB/FhaC/HecB family hemolysin secretion/activation protein [Chlamydiota bacterium]